MYEGTLSLHCLSFSSVKAGSSDLIRGLIFNEGSQRRTRGEEGGYRLVDLCEMAVASPDKNRGEGERETSARFKWREFVRFCRDVPDDDDVDSSVFSSVISKWTALQVSSLPSPPASPGVVTPLVFSLPSLACFCLEQIGGPKFVAVALVSRPPVRSVFANFSAFDSRANIAAPAK